MPKTTTTIETNSKSVQIVPGISYRLSVPEFLDAGWTSHPSVSQHEHQVITMKAKFSHPTICPRFKESNDKTVGKYSDGRILYSARNGNGKVYYPNGKVAVKIKKLGANKPKTQVWVYHSGDVERNGIVYPSKFCALFDSLGNGIVYDHCWRKRLVYNQKEGIWYNSKSDVPVRWKWHDIQLDKIRPRGKISDIDFEGVGFYYAFENLTESTALTDRTKPKSQNEKTPKSLNSGSRESTSQQSLSRTELEYRNRMDDLRYINTSKMKQRKVTPIKPIVMELNQYIALRILDQSNVSLSFFADGRHVKLNIGILLNPFDAFKVSKVEEEPKENEIICPFENFPVNTPSLLEFRKFMKRSKEKSESLCARHKEKEKRLAALTM